MDRPATIVTYGASGSGKTVDALYSFPEAAFLLPAEGGDTPWVALTGIQPQSQLVSSIDDVTKMIVALPAGSARGRVVVLDDFTVLAERTQVLMERTHSGWKLWGALQKSILNLREACINAGITLVLNCHEQPPKVDDAGNAIQGGPRMPSKAMTMALPHIANLVLQTGTDMMTQKPLWNGAYVCDPTNRTYVAKDRYCVIDRRCPMNMREILVRAREIGHDVILPPRPQQVAWIEDTVEQIAQAIAAGLVPTQEMMAKQLGTSFVGKDPRHLAWAHRDGFARAQLRAVHCLSAYQPAATNGR